MLQFQHQDFLLKLVYFEELVTFFHDQESVCLAKWHVGVLAFVKQQLVLFEAQLVPNMT
jgi:hypothetical protein